MSTFDTAILLSIDHLWSSFGAERFDIKALWGHMGIKFEYPSPEWKAWVREELERRNYIEAAPGPRGGEGWRIKSEFAQDQRKKADAEQDILEKDERSIA